MAERVVGGFRVVAGGTRRGVKLARPWQGAISPTENCPFESPGVRHDIVAEEQDGWRVIRNAFTPFSYHVLVVPPRCWPDGELRVLGGAGRIARALEIVATQVADLEQERWLGVHIGRSAGQNFSHLHYHLLEPVRSGTRPETVEEIRQLCVREDRLILTRHGFRAAVDGVRAGQAFIAPEEPEYSLTAETAPMVAGVLADILLMYNRAFRSEEGLPPDFALGLRLIGPRLVYGVYTPILSHWGFTEYFGILEDSAFVLPWPHEESVELLKGCRQ